MDGQELALRYRNLAIDVPLKIAAIAAIFGSGGALAGKGMAVALRSR
jgi:hypothetical protein